MMYSTPISRASGSGRCYISDIGAFPRSGGHKNDAPLLAESCHVHKSETYKEHTNSIASTEIMKNSRAMYKEPMIYDQKIATCQRTCAHVERERERERY
jgi:hypothetical protein